MTMKCCALWLCFLLFSLKGMAQRTGDTTLKTNTIEVIQAYKPEVKTMVRPELNPELPAADTSRPNFNYNVPQQTLYYTYRALPLRPIGLAKDTLKNTFPGYLKLGGGNLSTLYLDAGTAHFSGNNYQTAVHLSHISQHGLFKFQQTAFSTLDANGIFNTKQHEVNAGISLLRNEYFTFNYNHAIEQTVEQLRNRYTGAWVSLGAKNIQPLGKKFFYAPSVSLGIYSDNKTTTERAVNFSVPVFAKIDSASSIGINVEGKLAFLERQNLNVSNNIFSIRPFYDFSSGGFMAHLEVAPTFGRTGNTFLLPNISLSYRPESFPVLVSGGWNASLKQNTFRQLTTLNPYLAKNYGIQQTRSDEYFAGLSTSLSPHVTLGIRGAYQQFNNLPLFLNDTGDGRNFYIVYDATVNALNFKAFVRYQVAESFSAGITGSFTNYTKHNSEKLWHLPTTELKGDLTFKPSKKLMITAYSFLLSGIYARTLSGDLKKLTPIIDIGGSAEYLFIPRLAVFAKLTNVLDARNQRWNGYDAYGINLLGGLRLRF